MTISLDQLNEIFSEAFGQPVTLTENTKRSDITAWSSINHLNLIVELEEKLGFSFTPDEIQKVNSVAILLEILKSK